MRYYFYIAYELIRDEKNLFFTLTLFLYSILSSA